MDCAFAPEIEAVASGLGLTPRRVYTGQGASISLRAGKYFTLDDMWVILRLSRSKRPFFGFRLATLDTFAREGRFALVLLTSKATGYALSASQVVRQITEGRWRLARDLEYKIDLPLPLECAFTDIDRLGILLGMASRDHLPTRPTSVRSAAPVAG